MSAGLALAWMMVAVERQALAEPGAGEAGSDGEDHVGPVEEVPDLLADRGLLLQVVVSSP
jgi:hypothetical protein